MPQKSKIFEKAYADYLTQIGELDFTAIVDTLDVSREGQQVLVPFFGNDYFISKDGIMDSAGEKPSYGVCVVLSKYLLLCPDTVHIDTDWASFKDFKRTSHFTNINYFRSDAEQPIVTHFTGKPDLLDRVGRDMGGVPHEMDISYDVAIRFQVLPRVSQLLLFNDGDDEFPAECMILFQKQAEYYLDPESLAMTGAYLAGHLTNRPWA